MTDLVVIESPFNGTPEERARNARYLAWCIKDSLDRGESPFASHGLYTTAYPEDELHRARGIAAVAEVRKLAKLTAYYVDLSWTAGMLKLAKLAAYYVDLSWTAGMLESVENRTVEDRWEIRCLNEWESRSFRRGEWPPGTMRLVPVSCPNPPCLKEDCPTCDWRRVRDRKDHSP